MAESMKGLKRTHRCAEVTKAEIGSTVTLMGWVQKSRNKGGIVFVDLRDRSGIMQIIFENGDIDAFRKEGERGELKHLSTHRRVLSMKIWQQEKLKSVPILFVYFLNPRHRRSQLKRTARQEKKYV